MNNEVRQAMPDDVFSALQKAAEAIRKGEGRLIETDTLQQLFNRAMESRDTKRNHKRHSRRIIRVARELNGRLQPAERNIYWRLCIQRGAENVARIFVD